MTAAAALMVQVVAATDFHIASHASTEALKTATLLKSLSVNALIIGERGTGKRTLAGVILPTAPVVDASDFDNLLNALESNDALVLTHIEQCPNTMTLIERIRAAKVRIVATASSEYIPETIREFFSVHISLPPLHERPEDIEMLVRHFSDEADRLFGLDREHAHVDNAPDVSDNAISLRRQIYFGSLLGAVSENEVMAVMERYLESEMGSNNDYRRFLHLYEVPLIRIGLRKFKSQLQLAERLGLNRNTLRKKIAENEPYGLKEEK